MVPYKPERMPRRIIPLFLIVRFAGPLAAWNSPSFKLFVEDCSVRRLIAVRFGLKLASDRDRPLEFSTDGAIAQRIGGVLSAVHSRSDSAKSAHGQPLNRPTTTGSMEAAAALQPGGVGGSGHQLPGNEGVEKFPCLHSTCSDAVGDDDLQYNANPLQQPATEQRPHSFSLQSTASSSEYSEREPDLFDSRRASVISTASSFYSTVSATGSGFSSQQQPPQQGLTRSRRDAKQLHAARLQRSGSTSSPLGKKKKDESSDGSSPTSKARRFQRGNTISSSPQDAFAATEPPHEPLARMAFADQQRWITVQQKTFTKWLNTKLQERGLELTDLVKDLSDGVCHRAPSHV